MVEGTKFSELNQAKFGKLTVIGSFRQNGRIYLTCRCDCGTVKRLYSGHVLTGKTKSCGCLRRTHGNSTHPTPEYAAWREMRDRCKRETHHAFDKYGGRGITVCDRWETFQAFLQDMGPRPSNTHSLDRIDVNGNYEPSNCRWATDEEQRNNKRTNVFLELDGKRMTIAQWSRFLMIPYHVIQARRSSGWDDSKILSTPVERGTQNA
jgi:hypothetical protein